MYSQSLLFYCIILFFYLSRARKLWPLAIVWVTVGKVGMVGMVGTVDWQHVVVWQGFCHYMDSGGHPSGN